LDERFPWIELPDDPDTPTGFTPFKITKKQIPGLAQLLAHCGTHIAADLDEVEAELTIRQILEATPKGIVTGETACVIGKILDYASFVNCAPGNAEKSN